MLTKHFDVPDRMLSLPSVELLLSGCGTVTCVVLAAASPGVSGVATVTIERQTSLRTGWTRLQTPMSMARLHPGSVQPPTVRTGEAGSRGCI